MLNVLTKNKTSTLKSKILMYSNSEFTTKGLGFVKNTV